MNGTDLKPFNKIDKSREAGAMTSGMTNNRGPTQVEVWTRNWLLYFQTLYLLDNLSSIEFPQHMS